MHTAPHSPHALDHRPVEAIDAGSPTAGDILWEIVDAIGGLSVMLLPLLLLAVPGIALFLVLPALLVLAVVAVPALAAAAIVVPSYLLIRAVRSRPGTPRTPRHAQPLHAS